MHDTTIKKGSMRFPESTIPQEIPIMTSSFESGFGGHINVLATEGQGAPVLYGNGIGRAHEPDVIRAITATTDRPGFVVRPGGRRNPAPIFERDDMVHTETEEALTIPSYSVAEAASLLVAIEERHAGEPVDAILQSQSAIAGIVAAYKHPEAFGDMVLAYPAGLSRHRPRFVDAIRRAALDRRIWLRHRPPKDEGIHTRRTLAEKAHAICYGLRPVARARSAYALKTAFLGPMLHEIKQRPNAPGITLLLGLEDHIFRAEEYLDSLTASTDVDQIVIASGSHGISGRPEVLQLALDQLNVTKQMRAAGINPSARPMRGRIYFPPDIDPDRKARILQLADQLDARTAALLAKRAATKTS